MKTNNKAIKAIVSIPAWAEAFNEGGGGRGINTPQEAYARVPLIYRAVRLRCDAMASVPVKLLEGDTEVEWPYKIDLRDLIWKTEASLLLSGAAYWLKLASTRAVMNLQWINPFTVQVQWNPNSRARTFVQAMTKNGDPVNTWTENQVVYFHEWNPDDDVGPGIAAASNALNDAKLMAYMTSFSSAFFEGGAMPSVIVGVEGIIDEDERTRFEKWFRKRTSGVSNAFKAIVLGHPVTPTIITPPLDEMAFPELEARARQGIADAFGIHPTMFEESSNYATASEHRSSFWEDTIRPRCAMYEGIINSQLFNGMGMRIKLDVEELDVFQEDENERAASFSTYTSAGLPMALAAEMVGLELPEGWDYEKLQAIEDERKKQAEELARAKFGEKPGEDDKEDDKDKGATDLEKWQRKALKRVREGKSAACEFESDEISPAMYGAIAGGLETATTTEEVRAVFDNLNKPGPDYTAELKRTNELLEKLVNV